MFFYNILDMLELINSLSSNYYYILIISLKDTIFGFSIKYFPFIYMIISLPGIYIISILNLITINIIISIYERWKFKERTLVMVQTLIDVSIFSFFLLISFFINEKYVSLSKLHFAQMHNKFRFKFHFTDFSLIFTKEYSEKIIHYIYDIFWILIHIKNVMFYLHFCIIYLLKFFLYYLIFYFYYFFWYLQRIFFLSFPSYIYYHYFFFHLFTYYLNVYISFSYIGTLMKPIWSNYFALFYIRYPLWFFYYILYYYNSSYFFNQRFNFIIEKTKFSFIYLFIFYFNIYIFNSIKSLIFSGILSNFLLYILKYYIYLLFIFFDILLSFKIKNILQYFFYVNFFYLHLLVNSLIKYTHLFIFIIYYIFFNIIYNFIILFFKFFIIILKFFFKYIIFNRFVLLVLICFLIYNLYWYDIIFVRFIFSQLLDFVLYSFNFIVDLLDFFYFFYFFSIDIYQHVPYYKLTTIHLYLRYPEFYTIFIDFFYYLRILYIDYFPYKYYIFYSYIFYFKNFVYFSIYFNLIFPLMWYMYFFIYLIDINIINILFTWFVLLYECYCLFINNIIYNFLNSIDVCWLWFFYVIKFDFSLIPFLKFFDTSFIFLYFFDIFHFLLFINNNFDFDYIYLNFFISYFFILYDYFFHSNFQYPFNDYPEELNTLLDYKTSNQQRFKWRRRRWWLYRRLYFMYYKYRLRYGLRHFYNAENDIIFTKPFNKRRHWRWRLRMFTPRSWYYTKIIIPQLYRKYKYNWWITYTVRFVWNRRIRRKFMLHTPWEDFYYRTFNTFFLDNITPLTNTMGFFWMVMDVAPGYGYMDLDKFFYFYSIFLIIFIIFIFYIFSKSFRDFYFPKFWYPNNSEYLWRAFQKDISKHGLWLYINRANELPLGITDEEKETHDYFTYSKLADIVGIDGKNFLPFIDDSIFSSFYNTRYSGDFMRLAAFDFFCDESIEYNPYLAAMHKNETFYYFDDLKTEEKEYYSVPSTFDLEGRSILSKKLNDYFFSIDYFFDFKLPSILFHKELSNIAYFQFPDGGYYIPFDAPSSVENFNCWFLFFPAVMYYYLCFDVIYSMDTIYLTDIFQRFLTISSFSFFSIFFDFAYYIFYFDLIVDDSNSIESAWTWVLGGYDDRFFFSKFPVFANIYDTIHLSISDFNSMNIIDTIHSFFVSPSFMSAGWFIILSHLIIFIVIFIIIIKYFYNQSNYFMFRFLNKNINYVNKFIFYFYKKLKNKN